MGHNQSKARSSNKAPTSGSAPTAPDRLYPNLANEFPTYDHANTANFRAPTNPYPYDANIIYEACFGNTIPNFVHNAGPSYGYNPAPSAPPEIYCAETPATAQSFAKQEDWIQTRQAESSESSENQNRGQNNKDQRTNDSNPTERKPCPNADIGCKLHFDAKQMKQHLKECLFRDVPCPLNGVFGKCSWRDKVNNITIHFEDNHHENIGQVNQEKTLTALRTIHLVDLKPFKFLVHIKVDEAEKKTLVAVQAYTTQFCAAKWSYEFEFTGPHMEKKLAGTCFTVGVPIEEKFKRLQCRVLTMSVCVMDGFKRGGLKYKYRIMKTGNVGVTKKAANRNTTEEGTNRNTTNNGTDRNTTKKGTSKNPRVWTSKLASAT